MGPMTTEWTPDDENARTYERYRRAHKTEKDLKPTVRELAVADLRRGATINQLSERTGLLPEVFRRLAREHDIPVAEKYKSRAEQLRARRAATKPEPEPEPTEDKQPTGPSLDPAPAESA